jgi:hypothetical protein
MACRIAIWPRPQDSKIFRGETRIEPTFGFRVHVKSHLIIREVCDISRRCRITAGANSNTWNDFSNKLRITSHRCI